MWGRKDFYFGDNISVGVKDLDRAVDWYEEKLGLRLTPLKSEDFGAFLALATDDETGVALVTIPPGETKANGRRPCLRISRKLLRRPTPAKVKENACSTDSPGPGVWSSAKSDTSRE